VPFEEVRLGSSIDGFAGSMVVERFGLLRAIADGGKLLKIRRSYPAVDATNDDVVRAAEVDYLAGEIQRLGGVEAVLTAVPGDAAEQVVARFDRLVRENRSGVGYGGQVYELTDREIEIMKAAVAGFFRRLEPALVKRETELLGGTQAYASLQLPDHDLGDQLATYFAKRVKDIVFATTGETTTFEVELPAESGGGTRLATVRLPKFVYSQEARLAAAGLLRDGRSKSPVWGMIERTQNKEAFGKLLEGALTVTIDKVSKLEKLPKGAARWVLENRAVSGAL
jgi:hypothetical protein